MLERLSTPSIISMQAEPASSIGAINSGKYYAKKISEKGLPLAKVLYAVRGS